MQRQRQPATPILVKVNYRSRIDNELLERRRLIEGTMSVPRSSNSAGDDHHDEHKRVDESNGNRMKASAHKRQVGPATTTTTTLPTTRRARCFSCIRRPRQCMNRPTQSTRPLLILTLILAGGSSTLMLALLLLGSGGAQANHHARRALSSSAFSLGAESRELRPALQEPMMIDAADRVVLDAAPSPTRDPSKEAHPNRSLDSSSSSSGGNNNNNDDDDDKLIGLNVRESLMDLDRAVAESADRRTTSNGDGAHIYERHDFPPGAGYTSGNNTDNNREPGKLNGFGDDDESKAILMSPVRRLLVRQLTNLIMNHEPETIAARIEGARVRGQMSSETSGGATSGSAIKSTDGDSGIVNSSSWRNSENSGGHQHSHHQQLPSYLVASSGAGVTDRDAQANPEEISDNYLATSSGQDLDLTGGGGGGGGGSGGGGSEAGQVNALASEVGEPLATCPPDYEDPAPAEGSSQLDAEQQQQLLAGADSSGLLAANESSNGAAPIRALSSSSSSLPMPQCVHPGSRMIEVITKIITPILFTIIIIVGLLGNIIVMMVILEDRQTERELTPTNLLILDLSLADLSFIIFCIPFTGWDYSVGHWVFGLLWCKFNQYLIVVCALSSIYTLVLMSIDRFMAIVYPIECISYRTSKNTLYAIYIKWIVILLMASPTIAMHGLIDLPMDPHQYACRFLVDQYDPLHFQITFFITSYLFPLILIFCLYLSLLNKLWFGTKPHGHKESHKMLESKKKVTWLVAGIVVVFAICWCPIQVMLILMRLKSHRITATYVAIQVFAHTLGYMNSCVNPIVYAFASETFTNSFKRSVFGRFFRICFCLSGGQFDEHGRPNYNYHNTRPSNATFQNTTVLNNIVTTDTNYGALNKMNKNNNNRNSTNGNGSNEAFANHNHHQQDNSIIHHRGLTTEEDFAVGEDSYICSTKTSQMTGSCQSSSENYSNGRQVTALPLEPRDRGISSTFGSVPAATAIGSLSDDARTRDEQSSFATSSAGPRSSNKNQSRDKVLIPREATISRDDIVDTRAKMGSIAKQQLVARVVQTGNNQASQRCETACYQQGLMGP